MDIGLVWMRWALALVMLAAASWLDWKTRRVPNAFWGPWLWAGGTIWLIDLAAVPLWDVGVAALVAAGSMAVYYGLWRLRLYGGADAKVLMVLAVLVPWNVATPAVTPSVDALGNGLLLTMVIPVWLLGWNLSHGSVAGVATFTARRMPLGEARRRLVWPMETVRDDQVIRQNLPRLDEDLDARYEALAAHGVTHVWATPKLPTIPFLFAGLLLAAWQGDLILLGLQRLLGPA